MSIVIYNIFYVFSPRALKQWTGYCNRLLRPSVRPSAHLSIMIFPSFPLRLIRQKLFDCLFKPKSHRVCDSGATSLHLILIATSATTAIVCFFPLLVWSPTDRPTFSDRLTFIRRSVGDRSAIGRRLIGYRSATDRRLVENRCN